jgi:hypothetical protein
LAIVHSLSPVTSFPREQMRVRDVKPVPVADVNAMPRQL